MWFGSYDWAADLRCICFVGLQLRGMKSWFSIPVVHGQLFSFVYCSGHSYNHILIGSKSMVCLGPENFLLCDCCYFDLCCKWTVFHLKFIKQLNEVKDISCGSIISVVDWLFDQLHIDQWPQLPVVLMLWCTADKHSQSLRYCSSTNNHWYP